MAGQAKTRALMAELQSRADAADCPGLVEYVELWLEGGGSIDSLARDCAATADIPATMRATLIRKLKEILPEGELEQRLTRARTIGAFSLADDAERIADTATSDTIQQARLQVQVKQWKAERYNKEQFGKEKHGLNLSISVGGLHLEALRAPQSQPVITAAEVTGSFHEVTQGNSVTQQLLPQPQE